MPDFFTELKELFTEKKIPNIISDFTDSSFFKDHYLTQTFKTPLSSKKESSRFKKKSYYLNKTTGYPIQLNQELTKKLKEGNELKVIHNNNNNTERKIDYWKHDYVKNQYNNTLKLGNINLQETNELKMFTEGSNENPEQFETWSAEKMYKEWLLLRLSDIEKPNWQIMNYVFFLFINQISCMLNSYILYGNINSELEVEAYKLYLTKLDEFTKNKGLYKDLLDVHLLFCKWYEIRIKSDTRNLKKRLVKINKNKNNLNTLFKKSKEQIIVYRNITHDNTKNKFEWAFTTTEREIRELFYNTLKSENYCMLIFTSYVQNFKKFNRLYASPIFPILGIPFKTHDGRFYSAIMQIWHDYMHLEPLIVYYDYLYPETVNSNEKINDDTKIFFEKMLFLKKLNRTKESGNAEHFLWWVLHEQQFLYFMKLKDESKFNPNIRFKSFFDIKTLKKVLEELKQHIIDGESIHLGYSEAFINKNNENYNTVLSCIDLLIQVCDETLDDSNKNKLFNKIKKETTQFYNKNNLNNSRSFYGNNNNNNNFRKSLTTTSFNSMPRNKFYGIALGNNLRGSLLTNNNFSNPNNIRN